MSRPLVFAAAQYLHDRPENTRQPGPDRSRPASPNGSRHHAIRVRRAIVAATSAFRRRFSEPLHAPRPGHRVISTQGRDLGTVEEVLLLEGSGKRAAAVSAHALPDDQLFLVALGALRSSEPGEVILADPSAISVVSRELILAA